ncbi:hypothetical protein [Occallatibacter riparius]|uniref:Uncharacterized protein n=1 Tax=Occallatibacter riparius TaxID=1002689 RepID=A0A9J7BLM9_9BACT|nr:hypothetical protein [Occallatibacter riparius]UWZ83377.1 hypothetical protein MOP44_22765 [Occallatibacter riparius]
MKLIGGVILLVLLCFLAFWALPSAWLPIAGSGWLAMLGAAIALVGKTFITDMVDGKLNVYKMGNDMCAMAMGTSLATLVSWAGSSSAGHESHNVILMVFIGLALISTGSVCIAGKNYSALQRAPSSPQASLLVKVNAALGTLAIVFNLLMYALKSIDHLAWMHS